MPLQKGYSTNLGLPTAPITENRELWIELLKVYNAIRNVAAQLDNLTGAISEPSDVWSQIGTGRLTFGLNSKLYLEAAVAITYGQTIGIDAAGLADLADDAVLGCIGFCSAVNGAGAGDTVEIQLFGLYPLLAAASLTPGARYYQSTTAGAIGVGGTGTQCIGFAINDQQLFFNPQLQY